MAVRAGAAARRSAPARRRSPSCAPRLDLREELALLGADVGAGLHPDALTAWGAAPPHAALAGAARRRPPRWSRSRPRQLLAWLGGLDRPGAVRRRPARPRRCWPLPLRARVGAVLRAVELPGRDLGLLVDLLARIERESFAAPRLAALRAALDTGGVPPSRRIAQLERLINLLDARRNQFFAPLAPLLLWGTQLALAVEAWRAVSGPAVARWLARGRRVRGAVRAGDLRLRASATIRFRSSPRAAPLFEAEALGHPLLPRGALRAQRRAPRRRPAPCWW